jgi:flagellar FliJ protein
MNAPFKLQNLLDLAQSRADASARQLGQAFSREQAEEQKLQMLLGYRQDYQRRFEQSTASGLTPASWHNYQEFMKKLDLAVEQQREIVAQWHRRSAASQQDWEAQQRQVKSFGTLSRRHDDAEARREGKREQRESDDFAAKIYAQRANES